MRLSLSADIILSLSAVVPITKVLPEFGLPIQSRVQTLACVLKRQAKGWTLNFRLQLVDWPPAMRLDYYKKCYDVASSSLLLFDGASENCCGTRRSPIDLSDGLTSD